MARIASLALLVSLSACLPQSFDALEQAAPVRTIGIRFPDDPEARITIALSVDADDEGRGRVLFSDGEDQLGWLRLDEAGGIEQRFVLPFEWPTLTESDAPKLDALALVPDRNIPEGLVRLAADPVAGLPARVVRFRVPDFSRLPADPVSVPEWVAAEHPMVATLSGPLAAVQLDASQPELLSVAADGSLIVWPELGTQLAEVAAAREGLLAEDPDAFAGELAPQGYGLTRCAKLGGEATRAIAGGSLLAGGREAAVVLRDDTLHFIAAFDPPQSSLVGTADYDCEAGTLTLPEPAETLLIVDLERDGDDDLLVGAPAGERVYVWLGDDAGLASAPSFELAPELARAGGFGSSIARVDLGGDVGPVLVVGAPLTPVGDAIQVGRVHVFDLDGAPLTEFSDLEPRSDSRHGLGVHGLGLPGRDELIVSGTTELRIHWQLFHGDPRPE